MPATHTATKWQAFLLNVALRKVFALYLTATQTTISQGPVLVKPWLVTVVCFNVTVHILDELLQKVHLTYVHFFVQIVLLPGREEWDTFSHKIVMKRQSVFEIHLKALIGWDS